MPEADTSATDFAATATCWGSTEPDARAKEIVADAGAFPGLARLKWTVPPGMVVVWAKRHVVLSAGEPSRRESPPVAPEDHCWNSVLTSAPAWAVTTVAMALAFCTKSPTLSVTNCPGGTVRPW